MPDPFPDLLDKIDARHLPSLPHILLKLLEVCHSEEPSFEGISRILDKDTALAAKIVSIVNSPYYGRPTKIASLDRALIALGLESVKTVAISAAVYQVFSQIGGGLNLKRFWWHSLMCANLARLIAAKTGYAAPDEAYLAGLLHDIGQLVLWVNFPKDYGVMLLDDEEDRLVELERERLGATHCEIGAWLVGSWNLQSFIADAALYHHEPVERVLHAPELVKIVHLADDITSRPDGETGAEPRFGLDKEALDALNQQAREAVSQIAQSFEIDPQHGEAAQSEEETFEPPPAEPRDRRRNRGTIGRLPSKSGTASSDAQKRSELARAVRDIALLGGTHQNLAALDETDDLLNGVEQCLNILFGLKAPLFFRYERTPHALYGEPRGSQSGLVAELRIPLDGDGSLPSEALARRTPCDSFSREDASVTRIVDEQLIRLTQSKGILCLPLAVGDTPIGVIVCGIDRARLPRLEKQYRLITWFLRLCARLLHSLGQKRARATAAETENMALMRAHTRKIVHEVNNPLNIMKNYLQLLGEKLNKGDIEHGELKIVNEEIDRVSALIRELPALPTAAQAEDGTVDINGVVAELIAFTEDTLFAPRGITLRVTLEEGLAPLRVSRGKLKQILLNLFKNAAAAMPEGGIFAVSTRDDVNRDGASCIEITVQDSGHGIPPEIMGRLFRPVTSTKGEGHAGLGLSIVKDLVSQLGGSITCSSNEKEGTAFQVLLPKPDYNE